MYLLSLERNQYLLWISEDNQTYSITDDINMAMKFSSLRKLNRVKDTIGGEVTFEIGDMIMGIFPDSEVIYKDSMSDKTMQVSEYVGDDVVAKVITADNKFKVFDVGDIVRVNPTYFKLVEDNEV